jgi:hypothetical protein
MRGIIGWLNTIAVICLVTLAASTMADEKTEKISPDKLPQNIKESIKDRFPGADVTSAEKENENGQVMYDIELKHEGRKYEMDIKEEGTIVEIEKEVATKNVPEAIIKAVNIRRPRSRK